MFGFIVRIITAAGPVIYKIPGAGAAAQKIAAQLVKNGGKIIKPPKGGFKGPTKVATPANVAKAIKDLKKSNTGAGRPTGKKPGSNVKKKNETVSSSQQGPGGVTVKPSGGIVRPKGGSTKTKTKPPKKDPKSPFAKETKAQTAARIKKEKIAAQRMKDNNKTNPSRDPKGKYNKRPVGKPSVPKSGGAKKGGLKSRIDAKAKRAAMGLGVAAVKADNLSRGEIEIGPRTPLPKKAKNPSAARKKPMQNPRSLKRKAPEKKLPVKKPEVKKDESFGAAFKRNRAGGEPTFPWKDPKTGKTGKYTTRLKEESIKDHKKKFGVTGKY